MQLKTSSEFDNAKNCYSDGELFVICDGDPKPDNDGIFYTVCTFHMCLDWDFCSTYEAVSKGIIVMGNNAPCEIAGMKWSKLRCLI